jgi:hypothetical protein
MNQWQRWVLIVPLVGAAWYGSIACGLLLVNWLTHLCPAAELISGMCTAHWYRPSVAAVACFVSALAAVLIVLSCGWMAPYRKRVVVITTLVAGSIAAVAAGIEARACLAMLCAVVAGVLATMATWSRLGENRPVQHAFERTRRE